MSKIAEFLTKFDDQHLANLQCAAEDGTLVYHDRNRCLLHHFRGDYSVTKWESKHAALAREAEVEYRNLGPISDGVWIFDKATEKARRDAILPLIHAEWARRQLAELERQDEMDHLINKIEELTPVSPSIR